MFSRMVAYDKPGLAYAMQKLQSTLSHRRTRNGKEIPAKSLVCYANINPSSMIRAYTAFKAELDRELHELFKAEIRGFSPQYTKFNRMDKRIMNAVQKSTSRREFVDIDFDVPDDSMPREFCEFLRNKDVDFYAIETKSGYHVLLDKDTIGTANQLIFPQIKRMNELAKKHRGEVCFNKNGMIPIPGTLQSDKLVKFVDFLEEQG